mgnify:FL=1
MTPVDMLDFSESLIAIPLFFSNFLFYSESGYFDAAMEMKPLFHTWSLGVEEQFYMLFPLLVMFLWKSGLRTLGKMVLVIFVASLVMAQWSIQIERMFAFFMLPTRMWEMSLGVGVALIELNKKTPVFGDVIKNLAGVTGLLLIGCAIVLFDKSSPVPGYYALLPTVGTALIILFTHDSFVGRLIGNRLFVGVGLVSYSAYLWHQPLFAFLRIYRFGDTKVGQYASAILITFLLAFLTWKFVERPFRDRSTISLRRAMVVFLISGGMLVGIGVTGVLTHGFEQAYESRLSAEERLFLKNAKEISGLRSSGESGVAFPSCFIGYSESEQFYKTFKRCVEEFGPATILMGDSHASNVKSALASTGKYEFLVSVGGRHCHPYHHYEVDPDSTCDFEQIADFLKRESSSIKFMIYNQLGSYFILDEESDTLNHKSVSYAQSGKMVVAEQKIDRVVEYFSEIAEQINVVWLASWIEPRYPMHHPRKMITYGIEGLDYIPNVVQMFVQVDQTIAQKIADRDSKIGYAELYDAPSNRNFISLFEGECVAFNDKDHLSQCGEKIAGPIFDRKIKEGLESLQEPFSVTPLPTSKS